MKKPNLKWILIFNTILDLTMAVVMSISGTLLAKQKIVLFPNLVLNIVISFVLAFVLSIILPIPKISAGFAALFHIKPHTIVEKLVGNIPICLIFTIVVGGSLTLYNLFMAKHMELFGRAFLGSFIPMFLIMYVVVFIMTPIAAKIAANACRK